MKIRASAKIAIGFVVLVALGYFGWQAYAGFTVDRIKFDPIKPSRVNIVGIDPDSGYGILVANHAAQLIRGRPGEFEGSSGPESVGNVEEKKRVPIREMLQAMQGDEKALGDFISIMNEMQETIDWPTQHIVWKQEDVQKAISGDAVLRQKLERDINVSLEGDPLKQISLTAYENGILVETYVPCQVQVGAEVVTMRGAVRTPYRPRISKSIEVQLKEKAYDLNTLAGYYALEAAKIQNGEVKKENVAESLGRIIDAAPNAELARPAEQVLKSATVVVTDQFIDRATYKSYQSGRDQLNDITIELNDEGRKRLWQYSRHRVGFQLLLIVDGVAIAAPRISHELAQGELQITQLPDKILVEDAVNAINDKSGAISE